MKKQKLIILSGSPCVGKSAAGDLLFQMYENAAYLDGDWCWCVNPFRLDDPRLREGDKAMSAVLSNYLRLGFDYVVFSSVVLMYENIRQGILKNIPETGYEPLALPSPAQRRTCASAIKSGATRTSAPWSGCACPTTLGIMSSTPTAKRPGRWRRR